MDSKFTWVSAEHSTYLTALSSFASFSPISWVKGFCLFFANFSIVAASSRKSICVPTNRNGVFWQWWEISGTHWKIKKSYTMWKFQDFSLTQILREIKKCKNSCKSKFRASKCVKMADFVLPEWLTLISRRIWVTEKFCNWKEIAWIQNCLI